MKTNLIASKSMSFAVHIVKFYQHLCFVKKKYVLSKQSFALKEADEWLYRLELLLLSDVITQNDYQTLYKDAGELVALLAASFKKLIGKL